MKTNPLKEGILMINSTGVGEVTREMLRKRAVELALINGRAEQEVSNTDWEQAKRELNGEPEKDEKDTEMEAAPESERWDPVHGSTGHKVEANYGDDEDADGQSDSARLVEEGINEAAHDQMLQAARSAEATELYRE